MVLLWPDHRVMEITVRTPAFNLRMPNDLKAQLRAEAEANGRSLNSEIVYRLRMSLTDPQLRRWQERQTHEAPTQWGKTTTEGER
jgi:Arc-like DNA binding domain